MRFQEAGQIGLLEWVLIIIGILWLAGILRNTIYVPIIVKEKEKEAAEKKTKINEETTISKPKNEDQGNDYTPFEEIKD